MTNAKVTSDFVRKLKSSTNIFKPHDTTTPIFANRHVLDVVSVRYNIGPVFGVADFERAVGRPRARWRVVAQFDFAAVHRPEHARSDAQFAVDRAVDNIGRDTYRISTGVFHQPFAIRGQRLAQWFFIGAAAFAATRRRSGNPADAGARRHAQHAALATSSTR